MHYHRTKLDRLPPPHELASRIEEAKTSGKLLTQLVQSTPQNEILSNELIREFAERCREASRSIQGYINAESPPPDEHTLLTLIETNDAIAVALSQHQRALLRARKALSGSSSNPPPLQQNRTDRYTPTNGIHSGMNAQAIPETSSPPILNMPKQPERLENPFDDSNRSESAAENQAQASRYGDHNIPTPLKMPDVHPNEQDQDEDESSVPRRRYRF